MRRRLGQVIIPAAIMLTVGSALPAGTDAATARHRPAHHPRTDVSLTFRLQVVGTPAPGTTFWVAYGPLAGRFGILQLHASGSGRYTLTHIFPARARTVFTYLAGNGAIVTRFGRAPGDPTITIWQIGPVSLQQLNLPLVRWQAPLG